MYEYFGGFFFFLSFKKLYFFLNKMLNYIEFRKRKEVLIIMLKVIKKRKQEVCLRQKMWKSFVRVK